MREYKLYNGISETRTFWKKLPEEQPARRSLNDASEKDRLNISTSVEETWDDCLPLNAAYLVPIEAGQIPSRVPELQRLTAQSRDVAPSGRLQLTRWSNNRKLPIHEPNGARNGLMV